MQCTTPDDWATKLSVCHYLYLSRSTPQLRPWPVNKCPRMSSTDSGVPSHVTGATLMDTIGSQPISESSFIKNFEI